MSNTQNGNEEASAPEEVSPKKLGYRRRRAARHARFCSGSFHAAVAHTPLLCLPAADPARAKTKENARTHSARWKSFSARKGARQKCKTRRARRSAGDDRDETKNCPE